MLTGTITYIKRFEDTNSTKLTVGKYPAYIKRLIPDIFLGTTVSLRGVWKESLKTGKYFFAEALEVVSKKKNRPLKARLFGRKEVDEKAEKNIEILKTHLEVLLEAGKKSVAKKIVNLPTSDVLEIKNNPYILYLRGLTDFTVTEIIAAKTLMTTAQAHKDRIAAATAEILKTRQKDGKISISLVELIDELKQLIKNDVQEETIKQATKKVAVIEDEQVYIPKIYYLRKKTLKILQYNTPDITLLEDEPVEGLFSHKYVILTGPAGSGKTTILKKIESLKNLDVALTALTGKAANLLGNNAQTLHRLLGYGNGGFKVKELPHDIIIVDEASMLNWHTAFALFKAAKGHVILSGDHRQLPPVEGGSVLGELLNILPVIELNKVYRFAGETPKITTIKRKTLKDIVNTTVAIAVQLKRQGKDFQVITPVKGNIIGTYNLNLILQKHLNPNGVQINERLKIGDKVMVIKNCYDKEITAYNGQIGHVTDMDAYNIYAKLQDGTTLPFRDNELELAYAITVHKAQGSQWGRVLFVNPESEYQNFINEKMRHTATTRGIEETYVICS